MTVKFFPKALWEQVTYSNCNFPKFQLSRESESRSEI